MSFTIEGYGDHPVADFLHSVNDDAAKLADSPLWSLGDSQVEGIGDRRRPGGGPAGGVDNEADRRSQWAWPGGPCRCTVHPSVVARSASGYPARGGRPGPVGDRVAAFAGHRSGAERRATKPWA